MFFFSLKNKNKKTTKLFIQVIQLQHNIPSLHIEAPPTLNGDWPLMHRPASFRPWSHMSSNNCLHVNLCPKVKSGNNSPHMYIYLYSLWPCLKHQFGRSAVMAMLNAQVLHIHLKNLNTVLENKLLEIIIEIPLITIYLIVSSQLTLLSSLLLLLFYKIFLTQRKIKWMSVRYHIVGSHAIVISRRDAYLLHLERIQHKPHNEGKLCNVGSSSTCIIPFIKAGL